MRLNKRALHLIAFFLAFIASPPAHVSAVLEKGGTQAGEIIPGNPDDGEEILDYIVRFTNAKSYQNFVKTEVQLMNTVTPLSFMNSQVLKFSSEEDAEAWFAKRKDVQLFAKDEIVRIMSEETPYGIEMVEALGIEYVANSGIKACIIDTGYDFGHEDLPDGSLMSGNGTCTDVPCDWKEDPNSHGTHVAGTMAALTNDQGVVGVVSSGLMPMHIERALNNGGGGTNSSVLLSMRNCVEAGAKVVNMSLGGGYTSVFASYLEQLENEGTEVLFVAASGNRGDGSYGYPASVDSRLMMSVACVDSDSKRCSFSQYNDQVDIAAPGKDVLSTIPNDGNTSYKALSGTSMSSPHVAAVAALIWSHHPSATVADIRRALEISAIQPDPYSQGERNDDLGWGIVNAKRALEALGPSAPSISPSPTLNPTVSHQPSDACTPVDIHILPDQYPQETSWNLFNPFGDVIRSSDQENKLWPETLFELQTCLAINCADDAEYQFVIRDTYDDGITAPGYYEIYVNGDLIKRGGDFTTEDVTKFSSCIPPSISPSPTLNPTVSHEPSGEPSLSRAPSISPSPTLNPTTTCMPVDIYILPDKWPSETSWELINPHGDVIRSSDQEDKLLPKTLFELQTCLATYCADDLEYQFVIKDSRGDGIFFPGFYEIYVDGVRFKRRGGYGFFEDVTKFSLCAPTSAPTVSPTLTLNPTVSNKPSGECMPVKIRILPDKYPEDTSWELIDPRGDVMRSSDQEDPLEPKTPFEFQTCLATYCADDSEYQFVIRDSNGDGMQFPGFYEIYVDGDLFKRGGGYKSKEDVTKFSLCAPNPHSCDEDPDTTIGKKKGTEGAIVQHTCGWLGRKSDKVIQAWCRTTKWPDENTPPASYACPNTCDTCSPAAPSSAPTSVCSDSATDKFFFKADEDGNAVGKKCSIFQGRNERWIKKKCNIPVPVDHIESGYLSAKVVCPETCDNCSALEIEHLENKVAHIENVNEELENENQRYKYLLKLYNIVF